MITMEDESRSIEGYKELYSITRSGKIFTKRRNCFLQRNGDPYGFAYVHLSINGERRLYKTYNLWKRAFKEVDEKEYRGMK